MSEGSSEFDTIINTKFTDDERSDLKSLSESSANFVGPYAEKIEEWKEQGIGRLVKIPEPDGFRNLMYVLPNSEIRQGRMTSALILVPNKNGVDACTVTVEDDKISGAPSFDAYKKFSESFVPGKEDFIAENWRPDPSKLLLESFFDNTSEFSAKIKSRYLPGSELDKEIERGIRLSNQAKK